MKKLSCLSILGAFLFLSSCSGSSAVPDSIKAKFATMYPKVSLTKWEKEGNNFEAAYTDGSVKKTIVLDANGQPLQTETTIDPAALPPSVSSYIASHYATYKVHEAASIVSASNVQSYEVGCVDGSKDVELTFDKDGNFLKREEDND